MTDKEQIIIDGVDVSKCKYLPYCNDKQGNCAFEPNCYFKQLARKTQECEELFAKTYQMWMYYIANGINNASDLNIQYLLEDLGKITKMLAELCNIKDSTLSYYAGQAQDETNRYRKALEEIEEFCITYSDNHDAYETVYKYILNIINRAKGEE